MYDIFPLKKLCRAAVLKVQSTHPCAALSVVPRLTGAGRAEAGWAGQARWPGWAGWAGWASPAELTGLAGQAAQPMV